MRAFLSSVPSSIRWTLGILLVLVLAGLARTFLGRDGGEGPAPPPLVTVMTVKKAELADLVALNGAIAARDEVAISAEGEGGRVAAILVEVGDQVKAGAVLARLDTSLLAPQVTSLNASLEEAQANAAVARAEFRRAQAVAASGALSAQEIERREASAIAADAKVKVAKAQLSQAEERLRRTEIRAPFDGIVLTRLIEVGQLVGAGGGGAFKLGRIGSIEMRGNVAERDLPRLTTGQRATVRVTGVEQPFVGTVRLIGAVIDPQTRQGSVRIDLPVHRDLRPGAFASGLIETGRAARPLLPQTAVMSDARGNYVFVLNAENKVERREVKVAGSRAEGVVIDVGLRGGERVVVTAGPYLRVGEVVRTAG